MSVRQQYQPSEQLIRDSEGRTGQDSHCSPQAPVTTAAWTPLTISCHIVPRELLEVNGFKLLVLSVERAHDPWPGLLKHLGGTNTQLGQ